MRNLYLGQFISNNLGSNDLRWDGAAMHDCTDRPRTLQSQPGKQPHSASQASRLPISTSAFLSSAILNNTESWSGPCTFIPRAGSSHHQVHHSCVRMYIYVVYIYATYIRTLAILATPVTLCQGWQSGSNIRTLCCNSPITGSVPIHSPKPFKHSSDRLSFFTTSDTLHHPFLPKAWSPS